MSQPADADSWAGYEEILLPLGHKDDVNNLTDLAPRLINSRTGTIHFLHLMIEGDYSHLPSEWRIGSQRVTDSHHRMMEEGIDSEPHLTTGNTLPGGILEQATENDCDGILLGWGPKPKSKISSLITEIMNRAEADVIVFKGRGKPAEIESILYPVALVPNERRLRLIQRLMDSTGAGLNFAHVAGNSESDKQQGEEVLEDVKTTAAELGIESETRLTQSDNPVDKIIELSSDYDLMILGPSRGWWLKKALFGHKTDKIASRAECSVLMHKNPEQ